MTEDLFHPAGPTGAALPAVVAELERELAMRRSVYPRWVDDGRLDAATADHRARCIEAALALCRDALMPPEPGATEAEPALRAAVDEALAAFDGAARSKIMTLESWRACAVSMQTRLLAGLGGRSSR